MTAKRVALFISAILMTSILVAEERSSPPLENIRCEGASNTNGQTATFPFCLRLKSLMLNHLSAAELERLGSQKIFIGFDYFFPTNFSGLGDDSISLEQEAESRVSGWLAEHDVAIVGEVPARQSLSTELFEILEHTTHFKAIYDAVEERESQPGRAHLLNQHLHRLAQSERFRGRLKVLSFSGLLQAYSDKALKYSVFEIPDPIPNEVALFADSIHINDRGQVMVVNEWILPILKDLFADQIRWTPFAYHRVPKRRKLRLLAPFVGTSEEFNQSQNGAYWGGFVDLSQIERSAARLHLPKEITGADEDQVIVADDFDRVTAMRAQITDEWMKARFTELYGIATLMEYGSEKGADGLLVSIHENADSRQSFILNMEQTLNYVKTTFSPQGDGSFATYGYDYWSSYGYPLFFRKLQIMKGWPGVEFKAPSVNYHFRLQRRTDRSATVRLQMTVYPRVRSTEGEVQPWELVRSPDIDEPWKTYLQANEARLPKLVYQIDIRVQDL